LRADLRLADALEQARMWPLENRTRGEDLDWKGADAAFTQAFAARGLDVTGPGAAADLERIRRSPVKARLVTALDAWASVKQNAKADGWTGVFEAAAKADDSGDDARRRVREAMMQHDTKVLKELAASPNVTEWPPAEVYLLANALFAAGEREAVVRVLRTGQSRYPSDFGLNFALATALGSNSHAVAGEGIGFLRAAVAARPSDATAHTNLGVLLAGQPGQAA
jgi:Flp pilus assembly protein TadD